VNHPPWFGSIFASSFPEILPETVPEFPPLIVGKVGDTISSAKRARARKRAC
jgi:hypothetical protein